MIELLKIGGFLIGAIIALLLLISRLKWHPAIALLVVSIFSGLFIGLDWISILNFIWTGFYNVIIGIGLIILLGSVLGSLMETSGSLSAMTGLTLKVFGKKRPLTAVSVLGFLVGIPVFCDSGFIILSKVAKNIANNNAVKTGATSLALAGGLYTTHTLIPPTPGPIAAAANMEISDQLGLVMVTGLLVSIPVVLVLIFVSAKFFKNAEQQTEIKHNETFNTNYRLLLPIILALGLISLGSLTNLYDLEGSAKEILSILSHPVFALGIACMVAFFQNKSYKNATIISIKGIEQSIPIILITGAGGAFGQILKQSELVEVLSSTLTNNEMSPIVLLISAYLLALIIKSAQGSSTAALVITSSIIFPLVTSFDLTNWQLAVIVSAIGSGAMAISHANDSYFWVVTKFSGFTMKEGYQKYSLMTLALSLTGLISCIFLFVILS